MLEPGAERSAVPSKHPEPVPCSLCSSEGRLDLAKPRSLTTLGFSPSRSLTPRSSITSWKPQRDTPKSARE